MSGQKFDLLYLVKNSSPYNKTLSTTMRNFLLIIAAIFAVTFFTAKAQSPDLFRKPLQELTEKEADTLIRYYQSVVQDLEHQLQRENRTYDSLQKELERMKTALEECEKQLYALIGATPEQVDQFRQRLGRLEGKVREFQQLSDDELADRRAEVEQLENEMWELRGSKIAVLPEFYDRLAGMGTKIKGLYKKKKIQTYVVGTWARDRDCLWNIAGKPTIYNDPFLWPKIWLANDDQIRNPDIIYPGQVLRIPPKSPKTPEELKAERRYYRQKRQQMMEQQATPNEETAPSRAE